MVSGKQDVYSISDESKKKRDKIWVDQNKVFWMIFNGHLGKDWVLRVEIIPSGNYIP